MAKNANLHNAKKARNDEFYTLMGDIEAEICKDYYGEFFRNKVIYCNCDDHEESNFFKFFFSNYGYFGWKKLICTSYNPNGKGKIRIINGDTNHNGVLDENEYEDVELNGDGDFRSDECIEYLKMCDVVVTNPPFSLFREFVEQLMSYDKKFLIIGNHNAVTYKEIFPLIKENKMWTGRMPTKKENSKSSIRGNSMSFVTPNGDYKDVSAWWFTNIEEVRKNDFFIPKKRKSYKEDSLEYPKYDNYNAIEVGEWDSIPLDYDGIMGVPTTGLKYLNPEQFEIVDAREIALNDRQRNKNTYLIKDADSAINGKPTYARIAIRKKLS